MDRFRDGRRCAWCGEALEWLSYGLDEEWFGCFCDPECWAAWEWDQAEQWKRRL